ncbi:MAG: preQ(1) synthase [Pseudomonadota bacterium]
MSYKIEKTPRPGPSRELETFPNPHADRDIVIRINTPEFTCLCPKTDQPDFATIYVDYIPDDKCVELKSLKLYFWSYRDEGAFHEAVTGQILDDLVNAVQPRFMRVTSDFNVRGGVYTHVVVEHRARGWEPQAPVVLPAPGQGAGTI